MFFLFVAVLLAYSHTIHTILFLSSYFNVLPYTYIYVIVTEKKRTPPSRTCRIELVDSFEIHSSMRYSVRTRTGNEYILFKVLTFFFEHKRRKERSYRTNGRVLFFFFLLSYEITSGIQCFFFLLLLDIQR